MKKFSLVIFVLFLLIPMTAFSEGYVAATIGQSDIDEEGFDKGTAFSLAGGYDFNEHFAIELSYVDFGEADYDFGDGSIEADGFDLGLVATAPVADNFELFAKVGFLSWDLKAKAAGFGTLVSDDGEDFNYGLGVAFNVTESFSMFVQYHRYNFDFGEEEDDVDVYSVGVRAYF
jgi:OOP family OmpA-OmpF porin